MLRTCALGLLAACAAPLAISAAPLAASSDVVCKLAAGMASGAAQATNKPKAQVRSIAEGSWGEKEY